MSTITHPRGHSYIGGQEKDGKMVTLTTYDQTGGSESKLKYSFGISKFNRFPSVKLRNHEQVGYSLPSTKARRGAGFGIGDRFVDQTLKLKKSK